MKTLFVTGAEGFTGRHLVEYLRRRGYEVIGGVRNRARKLAFERRYGKALVCDVSDAINVARAIASVKPDGVIHLAGTAQPQAANAEPLAAYQSIVTGWANMLDAIRRVVPRARAVLTSTCEVYGNAGGDERPLSEDAPLAPVNTFGSLKATAESIARTFFQNYHTNVTIVRPFHYTGAGQSEDFFFGSVAKRLAEWDPSAQGNQLQLPDLNFKRDLLHVSDMVEAYACLLEEGRPNEVYNVCSGRTWTVREIVELIVRAMGRTVSVSDLPTDEDGQVPWLCGDNSKACSEFGWQPRYTIEQAVTELTQSYLPQESRVGS
ncbi:MAG: NAD-dependent epimerase/dehydratase family protein [Phycisphaerae bacterium]